MNILFIIDPFHKLTVHEDTTIAIMAECSKRGHTVFACHADELILENTEAYAWARKTTIIGGEKITWKEEPSTRIMLNAMQVIFMRMDPPFNSNYLTATYILSRVDSSKTFVVNPPEMLRNYNEKLISFYFPEYSVSTIVTAQKSEIRAFVEKHKIAVIKPLYDYGGHGICILKNDDKNLNSIIELVGKNGTESVMVQRYIPEAVQGDIRVLILNGKILGKQNRLAGTGDYRNNRSSGGSLAPVTLSAEQQKMCEDIAARLLKMKIYFAGLDVIGNFITEINITSPTGLVWINKLDHVTLEPHVVDFFETYESYLTKNN